MKKVKSPGADGIPVNFYQTFYESVKTPLLNTFNWSYSKKQLTETQQEGLISLLLKQDSGGRYKDPTTLKNWRPITLQCNDAKILAKCLANRLKLVLPNIIHPDQCGFLQCRSISDSIRQIIEIIEYYDSTKTSAFIFFFFAAFEKAFDKVRLDFIYKCLEYFNFGDSLISWIKSNV